MPEEKKDFVIKDRRFFAEENQEKRKEEEAQPDKSEAEKQPAQDTASVDQFEEMSPLPEINFATFIFSLNSSALVQLGILEDPATNRKTKNLPIAKQTIDILGMLEEKTKGNLSQDEANLLKNILYDLRLMYVKEKS